MDVEAGVWPREHVVRNIRRYNLLHHKRLEKPPSEYLRDDGTVPMLDWLKFWADGIGIIDKTVRDDHMEMAVKVERIGVCLNEGNDTGAETFNKSATCQCDCQGIVGSGDHEREQTLIIHEVWPESLGNRERPEAMGNREKYLVTNSFDIMF